MWGVDQPFDLILVVAAHPIKFLTSHEGDPFNGSNRARASAVSDRRDRPRVSDPGNNRSRTSANTKPAELPLDLAGLSGQNGLTRPAAARVASALGQSNQGPGSCFRPGAMSSWPAIHRKGWRVRNTSISCASFLYWDSVNRCSPSPSSSIPTEKSLQRSRSRIREGPACHAR